MPHAHHLPNLLGALATSLSDEMQQALEAEMGAAGSAPAALLAIDTWPGRSIDFLRDVLDLTHSGTVRVVDGLASSGLIHRSPGSDRRTRSLRLTAAGRKRVERMRAARRNVLQEVLAEVTTRERQTLLRVVWRALQARPRSRAEAHHACRLCDHGVCRGPACPVGASVHEG